MLATSTNVSLGSQRSGENSTGTEVVALTSEITSSECGDQRAKGQWGRPPQGTLWIGVSEVLSPFCQPTRRVAWGHGDPAGASVPPSVKH